MQKYNLPVNNPRLSDQELINLTKAIYKDKKNRSSQTKFILPKHSLGEVELYNIDTEELIDFVKKFAQS